MGLAKSKRKDFKIEKGVLEAYLGDAEYVVIPKSVRKIRHRAFCARRDIIRVIEFEEGTVETMSTLDSHACCEGAELLKASGTGVWYPFEKYGVPDEYPDESSPPLRVCHECNEHFISTFSHLINLQYVSLPASLEILADSFTDCPKLLEIHVSAESKHFYSRNGVLFSKDKTRLLRYPPASERIEYNVCETVNYIGGAFIGCKNLKSVVLPPDIETVCFNGCINLESVCLPTKLKEIHGFEHCVSLKEINIPEGLKYIRQGAFENCMVEEIRIPDSYNEYAYPGIFANSSIKKIILPERFRKLPLRFWGCDAELIYYGKAKD